MSKETFKIFVRNHPELVSKVNNQEMTWQRFYEMYDMYGEDSNVWKNYFSPATATTTPTNKDASLQELINMVKEVDLDTVRRGINGLQKAIGIVQDLGIGSNKNQRTESYQPRPMYKYFED